MTLQLHKNRTISEIQEAFHKQFPFLKLAFFKKSHEAFEGNHAKHLLSEKNTRLGDLNPNLIEGDLTVLESTTVMDLEKAFEDQFGLHVQVFRKSGSIYLETSVTDNLTLAEQTQRAKDSEWHQTPIADPMDYREQL